MYQALRVLEDEPPQTEANLYFLSPGIPVSGKVAAGVVTRIHLPIAGPTSRVQFLTSTDTILLADGQSSIFLHPRLTVMEVPCKAQRNIPTTLVVSSYSSLQTNSTCHTAREIEEQMQGARADALVAL